MIGNFSIGRPEIGETAGKPAADIVLGNMVTASPNSIVHTCNAGVCRIQIDEHNRNRETSVLRLHEIVSQRSTRHRRFNDKGLVSSELFLQALKKLATSRKLL